MKELNFEFTYNALKLDFESFPYVLIPYSNAGTSRKFEEYIIAAAMDYTSSNSIEKEDFYLDRLRKLLVDYKKAEIEKTMTRAKNEFDILVTYLSKYK